MLEYLQKFNELPEDLRKKISTPEVMQTVAEIEAEFNINLATVIMRVMVGDLSLIDLPKFFVFEHKLEGSRAEELVEKLKYKIFIAVADYLGIESESVDIDEVYANKDIEEKPSVPDLTKIQSSNFFFSPEDEEEVRGLAKKLEELPKVNKINPDNLAKDIASNLGITFSSQDMMNRFYSVIGTFVRGVRNRIDTRDVLVKEPVYGGLGLFENEVDQIMRLADEAKIKFNGESTAKEPPKIVLPEDEIAGKNKLNQMIASGGGRDIEYDLAKMPKVASGKEWSDNNTNGEVNNEEKKPEQSSELEEKRDPLKILAEEETRIKNPMLEEARTTDMPKLQPAPATPQIKKLEEQIVPKEGKFKPRVQVLETSKKKVEDVKHVPKTYGPIEELKTMTQADFKRLDPDPLRAVAKIKEKIQLQEDEKFVKKIEAIMAWRQSPLMAMYINLGLESIKQKQPINTIIKDYEEQGTPVLSLQQFEAIINLNREIRF